MNCKLIKVAIEIMSVDGNARRRESRMQISRCRKRKCFVHENSLRNCGTYYFSMKIETNRKLEIFRTGIDNEVPFRFFIDVRYSDTLKLTMKKIIKLMIRAGKKFINITLLSPKYIFKTKRLNNNHVIARLLRWYILFICNSYLSCKYL